jgi:hypothetical protein
VLVLVLLLLLPAVVVVVVVVVAGVYCILLLCYYVIMLLLCYYVIVLLCYYVIHNRCIFPFNSFAPSDSHRKKHLLIIPGAERSESRNTTLSQPGLQANRHTRLRPMPGINDLRNFAKSAK